MNSKPKISIIIPSYNQGKFIEQAIQSILLQDYSLYEIIIIDGGSTDNTLAIINKYKDKIHYFISEPDKGQSDAMNKGILKASGDLIVFLNTDDYFLPKAFSLVASKYILSNKPIFIVAKSNLVNEDGTFIYTNHPCTELYQIHQLWRFSMPQNPVAYFYSPRIHDIIGPYNTEEHFAMDYEFLLKAYKISNIVYVDEIIGCCRYYKETKTFVNGPEKSLENIKRLTFSYSKKISQAYYIIINITYFLTKLFEKEIRKVEKGQVTILYKSYREITKLLDKTLIRIQKHG